jgi:ABC-type multidrug transport system ATPase subunit
MLTLSDITKTFDRRRVLDRLTLEIGAGESVALLGANGSGKTTTLRCIVGLARPDSGRIAIGGIDASPDGIAARRQISYLPQTSVFPVTLTVHETLAVIARLRKCGADAIDRELESCGLSSISERNVGHLSGGERQRLAMAVAFLPDVDLYLFDEPSANLDPWASRILFQRVRELKRAGRTLLFTTHIPADVRHLASRAVLLRNGRIESEAAGAFELRRCERMLERDLWGDDDDDVDTGADAVRSIVARDGLRGAGAFARASAGRSR